MQSSYTHFDFFNINSNDLSNNQTKEERVSPDFVETAKFRGCRTPRDSCSVNKIEP